jgi:hypothetical protein
MPWIDRDRCLSREATMTAWLLAWVVLSGCAGTPPGSASWSDAPDPLPMAAARAAGPASYDEALRIWKTPEDIAAWSAARFTYDTDRALQLSETERQKGADPTIPAPADLFERPTGTCLDLARFGLETLQRHWLVSFRRGDGVYVFADSKRPWLVAGPYNSVDAFIREYERFRGRNIVRFYETDSYRRQLRQTRTVAP